MPWYDTEEFWKQTFGFMFPPSRWANSKTEVAQLLRLARKRKGQVLDLCCGPGRHSRVLCERGFQVEAVDKSAFLLNKARRLCRELDNKPRFIQRDMRSELTAARYDLVLNLFTAFGYFDDRNEDCKVVEHVYHGLKPGGKFILDIRSKEGLRSCFTPTSYVEKPGYGALVEHRVPTDDWSRMLTKWIVIRGSRAWTFPVEINLYTGKEIRDLLRSSGFKHVALYGDYEGTPNRKNSKRLIALAEKS